MCEEASVDEEDLGDSHELLKFQHIQPLPRRMGEEVVPRCVCWRQDTLSIHHTPFLLVLPQTLAALFLVSNLVKRRAVGEWRRAGEMCEEEVPRCVC